MKCFLIFSLLFSAAICTASLVHQPDDESNLKEQASPLLRESNEVNRWLSQVEVFAECTNSTYTNPDVGFIFSPNYPDHYPENIFCTYLIDLSESAGNVRLYFLDFDTASSIDYVKVYDGPEVNENKLLRSITGSLNPASVLSTTPQMLVTFTTGTSLSDRRGFNATYSSGGCGETFRRISGNIKSPNYGLPGPYLNDLDCEYFIDLRASGASSVTLTFTDLETESGVDIVYVYEGLTTSGPLLLRASGFTIPPPVVSRTARMLVRFTTDRSIGYSGFYASYEGN